MSRGNPVPAEGLGGHAIPLEGVDREEAKIYLQSIPAEEVTRDFLQALLQEHEANKAGELRR